MASSTAMTTRASEPARLLRIPVLLWLRLILDLHRRGNHRRESGAFLLGVRGTSRDTVKGYALYDDLDPHALDTGIIVFDGQCQRAPKTGQRWALENRPS